MQNSYLFPLIFFLNEAMNTRKLICTLCLHSASSERKIMSHYKIPIRKKQQQNWKTWPCFLAPRLCIFSRGEAEYQHCLVTHPSGPSKTNRVAVLFPAVTRQGAPLGQEYSPPGLFLWPQICDSLPSHKRIQRPGDLWCPLQCRKFREQHDDAEGPIRDKRKSIF